ncbi:MAG TPA: tetratricopeptide repeat protein [bacterium]|nr:tetratricopeptide repeat protein [bacterium]HPR87747.1 tetratricopeptide repeat protein [bacterium]
MVNFLPFATLKSGITRGFLLLGIILLSVFPGAMAARAAETTSSPAATTSEQQLIQGAMELLNQGRHDSLLVLSSQLMAHEPENPIGYFLAADVYQTMMRDFRVKSYGAQFDSLIRIAAAKAAVQLQRAPSAENHFISGTVNGYHCLALFQAGSYLKALKTAENSIALMRKATVMDPGFADPLFAIAIYEYNKSKFLFGILGGDEREAAAKLRRVERQGRYVAANASYALQAMYFDHQKYDSAMVVNDKLYQRYPENPSCLYNRARLLEKTNRLPEALALWNKLIPIVQKPRSASNGYLAECHYHLAWIQHQQQNSEAARQLLVQAARFASRRRGEEEVEGSFVKFKDIKKEINTALREWGQ